MKRGGCLFLCIMCCLLLYAQDSVKILENEVEEKKVIEIPTEKEDISNYTYEQLIDYGTRKNELSDYDLAIEAFDKAILLNPKSAIAYDKKGSVYTKTENYTKAAKAFNQALKLDPKFAEAYNHRGIVNFYNNNLSVALNDYTKAIELKPDFAKAYYNRALVHLRYDNKEAAFYDLKDALRLGYKQSEEIIYNYCTEQLFKSKRPKNKKDSKKKKK